MDQQKDDMIRPDGRQDKKRAETQRAKNDKTSSPMSSWWAKDDTRDQKEGRIEGLGPSPCRPAAVILSAERRGDCVRASWFVVFVIQRVDRHAYHCCTYLVQLLLCISGSAQLDFSLIKGDVIFRFDNSVGRVVRLWPKI